MSTTVQQSLKLSNKLFFVKDILYNSMYALMILMLSLLITIEYLLVVLLEFLHSNLLHVLYPWYLLL